MFRVHVVQINRSVFPPYLPLRHGFARPPWAPSVTSRSASATPWRRRRAVDSCRTCDARLGGTRQGNSLNSVKAWLIYPSGKHTKNYGKSPFLMGNLTISMAMFNSHVKLPEGILDGKLPRWIERLCWTFASCHKIEAFMVEYLEE